MAGDMNSAPASVPQLELAKHFATLNDTTSYTFSGRPSQPMYRLHLRLFQEWVSDTYNTESRQPPFHPTIVRFKSLLS